VVVVARKWVDANRVLEVSIAGYVAAKERAP
jgi:hypothetical protein